MNVRLGDRRGLKRGEKDHNDCLQNRACLITDLTRTVFAVTILLVAAFVTLEAQENSNQVIATNSSSANAKRIQLNSLLHDDRDKKSISSSSDENVSENKELAPRSPSKGSLINAIKSSKGSNHGGLASTIGNIIGITRQTRQTTRRRTTASSSTSTQPETTISAQVTTPSQVQSTTATDEAEEVETEKPKRRIRKKKKKPEIEILDLDEDEIEEERAERLNRRKKYKTTTPQEPSTSTTTTLPSTSQTTIKTKDRISEGTSVTSPSTTTTESTVSARQNESDVQNIPAIIGTNSSLDHVQSNPSNNTILQLNNTSTTPYCCCNLTTENQKNYNSAMPTRIPSNYTSNSYSLSTLSPLLNETFSTNSSLRNIARPMSSKYVSYFENSKNKSMVEMMKDINEDHLKIDNNIQEQSNSLRKFIVISSIGVVAATSLAVALIIFLMK